MIKAEILLDSKCKETGTRLTTTILTYPRFIHSEVMTHRVLSRNAASSRAIPVKKVIEEVRNNPALPVFWGKNQSGMQAKEELSSEEIAIAKSLWIEAGENAIKSAEKMMAIGLHKQIANRVLEPWFHMRTLVTATEWENFFALRRHKDAQPEFKALADALMVAMENSKPQIKYKHEWHLPFIKTEEWDMSIDTLRKISTARCCRISYLNLDGSSSDPQKDIALHDGLVSSGHMSPLEHAAKTTGNKKFYGNFYSWKQYRKFIVNEDNFAKLSV